MKRIEENCVRMLLAVSHANRAMQRECKQDNCTGYLWLLKNRLLQRRSPSFTVRKLGVEEASSSGDDQPEIELRKTEANEFSDAM